MTKEQLIAFLISGIKITGRQGNTNKLELAENNLTIQLKLKMKLKLILAALQLQVSLKTDDVARRSIVDPAIHKECSDESVKTVMEICVRCLSNEPTTDGASVEDVLWNLQFAAQVQDLWSSSTSTATQGLMPIVSLK